MNIKKAKLNLYKSQKKGKKPTLQQRYKSISYKLFGRFFASQDNKDQYNKTRDKLLKADLHMTPGIYKSMILMTLILVTFGSGFLFTFIFKNIMQLENWLTNTIILTIIAGGATVGYFPFVLSNRISNRRSYIDQDIPFTLSELSILATTGLSPIKIFRNMTNRNRGTPMNSEFRKIIYKVDIDGKDIITAMSETAQETPSSTFREVLWDMANMIHQGGDLDEYLRNKADTTMQLKRDIQKEFIEKLATYSEMYISLILVGIIMLGIAAFLMDAMGSTIAGLDASAMLLALAFGLIPLSTILINVLVGMAYSKNG